MLAWPNSHSLKIGTITFCLSCRLKKSAFRIFVTFWKWPAVSDSSCSWCHVKTIQSQSSRNRSQRCFSYHWCVPTPLLPNTVKLISSHHRGSFWLSDESIPPVIINCDTRNHWKAVVLKNGTSFVFEFCASWQTWPIKQSCGLCKERWLY